MPTPSSRTRKLPILALADWKLIEPYLSLGCRACDAMSRRAFSAMLCGHVLGIPDLATAKIIPTMCLFPRRKAWKRYGLFSRLAADDVLGLGDAWEMLADGPDVYRSAYFGDQPRRRLAADFGSIADSEIAERVRQLSGAASNGSGFALSSINRGIEENLTYRAKRRAAAYRRIGASGGNSADAIAVLGERVWASNCNVIAQDRFAICLEYARGSSDAQHQLDAFLASAKPRSGREKKWVIIGVPRDWIEPTRQRWTVYGLPATLVTTDDVEELDIDGSRFPVDSLGKLPADVASMTFRRVMPRFASSPAPF